jgi:adenylyl-sulfate kinase
MSIANTRDNLASNVSPSKFAVTRLDRSQLMHQRSCIVWLTGLSGAGKSTIANLVDSKLHKDGRYTYIIDGDNLRCGLNSDLGFSDIDRIENIRRTAEVARLMADAGLIVLVCLISPFRRERALARASCQEIPFIEVHVDATLAICERRDPKGLYQRARRGEIKNFTGIDSIYEAPETPEIRLETGSMTENQAAIKLLDYLERHVISL